MSRKTILLICLTMKLDWNQVLCTMIMQTVAKESSQNRRATPIKYVFTFHLGKSLSKSNIVSLQFCVHYFRRLMPISIFVKKYSNTDSPFQEAKWTAPSRKRTNTSTTTKAPYIGNRDPTKKPISLKVDCFVGGIEGKVAKAFPG